MTTCAHCTQNNNCQISNDFQFVIDINNLCNKQFRLRNFLGPWRFLGLEHWALNNTMRWHFIVNLQTTIGFLQWYLPFKSIGQINKTTCNCTLKIKHHHPCANNHIAMNLYFVTCSKDQSLKCAPIVLCTSQRLGLWSYSLLVCERAYLHSFVHYSKWKLIGRRQKTNKNGLRFNI